MKEHLIGDIEEVKSGSARLYSKSRQAFFKVKGNAMDDGSSKAIRNNDIVYGHIINVSVLKEKLKIEEFPFWVIWYSREADPILKQILEHNTDEGYIIVNDFETNNLKIETSEIQGLIYITHLTRSLIKDDV